MNSRLSVSCRNVVPTAGDVDQNRCPGLQRVLVAP